MTSVQGVQASKCPFFKKMYPPKNAPMPLISRLGPACYLMKRSCYLNHSCVFFSLSFSTQNTQFLQLVSSKIPLNWRKIQNGLFLQNNKIVKQGNFVTAIKIFTGNNLIISIVFIHSFPFWRIQDIFLVNDGNSVTLFYMVLMLLFDSKK